MSVHDIVAVDVHSHINRGSPFDSDENEIYSARLDRLEKLNEAAGVGAMFCSTFASVLRTETVAEENEYMHRIALENSRVFQWVVIEPRSEQTFAQAERILGTGKCAGIKLHPPCHGYSLDEFGDRIFSFASGFGAVVLIHPESSPEYILPFADRYPEVSFIMAHLGSAAYAAAIGKAKHGNVYADTSGIASSNNNVLEYTVGQVGSERILYGSDTYAPGFQRGRIGFSPLSDTDKKNILRGNAIRLFGRFLKGIP